MSMMYFFSPIDVDDVTSELSIDEVCPEKPAWMLRHEHAGRLVQRVGVAKRADGSYCDDEWWQWKMFET